MGLWDDYYEWADNVSTDPANRSAGIVAGGVVGLCCVVAGFAIGGLGGAIVGAIAGYFVGYQASEIAEGLTGCVLIVLVPVIATLGGGLLLLALIQALWGVGL
jgi:fructose-specific phosphotransferase system IIC component